MGGHNVKEKCFVGGDINPDADVLWRVGLKTRMWWDSAPRLTGPGSGTYAPVKDAFDVYFNEVNSKGGINGHPVKIIFEDNAAQPSKAASDAKKFATQDKVILMMNASLSSTYAPMIQTAEKSNIPILFAAAVCPAEVYPPKPDRNQFCSTAFAAKYDSRFAINFIKEEAKGTCQAEPRGHEHTCLARGDRFRGGACVKDGRFYSAGQRGYPSAYS